MILKFSRPSPSDAFHAALRIFSTVNAILKCLCFCKVKMSLLDTAFLRRGVFQTLWEMLAAMLSTASIMYNIPFVFLIFSSSSSLFAVFVSLQKQSDCELMNTVNSVSQAGIAILRAIRCLTVIVPLRLSQLSSCFLSITGESQLLS